ITASYTDTKGCTNTIIQLSNIFDKPFADFNFDSLYCANVDTVQITQPSGSIFGTFSIEPNGGLAYDTLKGSIIPRLSSSGTYIITNTVSVGACPAELFRDTVVIRAKIKKPELSNWIDTIVCPNFVDSITYTVANSNNSLNYTWIVNGGTFVNADSLGESVRVKWDNNPLFKSLRIVANDGFCSTDTSYSIATSLTNLVLFSVSDSVENDQFIKIRYSAFSTLDDDSVMIFRRIALPTAQDSSWTLVKKSAMPIGIDVFTDGPLATDRFAYEYRLGAVNRCGDTTFTDPHRTIVAKAEGNEKEETVALEFNAYKGWIPNVYEVYRQLDKDPEFRLFNSVSSLNDTSLLFRNVSSDGFNQCYRVLAKLVFVDSTSGKQTVLDSSWSNITCVNFKNPIKVFNSFSPNGDGVNEFFWVNNINLYPDNEVFVFNRWGARVFHRAGYNNNWDGGGLPDGTYFYTIRVEGDEYRGYVYIGR
ncbi:MAG: gliding motility-associated C-terminal domain-containing protein, partial [Cytophagales bacterium]